MQILERGFHHADPHPGNLLRMSGDRLAYIDFGMMGDIQTGVRRQAPCSCAHMQTCPCWILCWHSCSATTSGYGWRLS